MSATSFSALRQPLRLPAAASNRRTSSEDGLFAWPHLEMSIFASIGVGKDVSMEVNSASFIVAQQGINTILADYKLNAALRSFRFGNMAV